MTALSSDAELVPRIAELERQLQARAEENARLQRELGAARDAQNASGGILSTIAATSGDADHALQQIAETTARLFGASSVSIQLAENGEWGKAYRYGASAQRIRAAIPLTDIKVGGRNMPGAVIGRNQQIHAPDLDNLAPDLADFPGLPHARAAGTRVMAGTPLRSQGKAIGSLIVHRDRPEPFTPEELALQQSFADQAAIAIENARLFNETREALERQTATADILKVIASSPSDVRPVFEAIATSSKRLIGGFSSTVFRFVGGIAYLEAFTPTTPEADAVLKSTFPRPAADFAPFRLAQAGEVMQIPDTEALSDEILGIARARGFRSMLFTPLMNKGESIGFIAVTRLQAGSFTEHHVQLLRTFADQAVIAIENVRLFDEVQAKTRDLEESLRQQTATAEVLKVISRSAFDLQTVLDTLTESAARLCGADVAAMTRLAADGAYRHVTRYGFSPEWLDVSENIPLHPERGSLVGRVLLSGRAVQIQDVLADPEYTYVEQQRAGGYRTLLGVPLLRSGLPIGVLFLGRRAVEPFAEQQVELVSTFADQAVIAIENVRLFDEVQAKTRDLTEALQQQTATADVLKTISRSAFDLQTVLDALLTSACRLCEADIGTIRYEDGDSYRLAATFGCKPEWIKHFSGYSTKPDRSSVFGQTIIGGRTVHMPDVLADPNYARPEAQKLMGFRTALGVPLVRDGHTFGVISLFRFAVGSFEPRQIEIVETFADQAVIAIENVRLFDEVQTRTKELAASLDELRAAQDRLVQTEKLASLGQLTAGIAHEIKNPLNFVNNFSVLSVELLGELGEALTPAPLNAETRAEIDEIAQMLKGNLEKVVQHGKRADSIVKNMLLHSREGSGERRPADINAIVEESLNLAYHGARAEKSGFNITLHRDLDPDAGMVEVFPQEITRVFLNLISNAFYAATKRKEAGEDGFEPMLTASTRSSANGVEVRIRDNGTGIPEEVRAKIFNPFFTTKPAGEGTGLGLSMSHDIVVKQHGGSIDVDTQAGSFTEFIITLPRAAAGRA